MSYFSTHFEDLAFRVAEGDGAGLRNAQLGAIFAIGSHFTVSRAPGLVVMPTGSGKTAVLMMTPFMRRKASILVVTTSRLVRSQIADEIENLDTLKKCGVLPKDLETPKVHELEQRIQSAAEWEELRGYDVVVATPWCISPAIEGVPSPPSNLFSMLLVDEAHHTPAKTWNAVLDAFPDAEKVLFTATPYRHDGREIKGKLVYAYPLKTAFEDKIFGKIRFVPVTPAAGESSDVAIARAAEAQFKMDRGNKLTHCVMVRTDSKTRADQLKKIYEKHTSLKLRLIHSGLTYSTTKKAIQELRDGNLDGVICVDMMSEGFDFPQLKIAAIHSPHKSLAVTLQFIGRFARTNAKDIGEAKFIAVPAEVAGEIGALYRENAIWQDIVLNLSGERLIEEEHVREAISKFGPPIVSKIDADKISLYSLWPFNHVKIYKVFEAIDIETKLALPRPFDVVHQQVAKDLSAAVVITNEQQRPRWADIEILHRSEYDLFVMYFDATAKLLFINASRKSDSLYEQLARQYTRGHHKALPTMRVNRVLRDMAEMKCFNVGMRKNVQNSTDSYVILAGPNPARSIEKNDGRLYHRGHVNVTGEQNGEKVTLGYSSASKVWSNQNTQIPHLIDWCKALSKRIANDSPMPALAGIDNLPLCVEVTEFPENVIAAVWDFTAFKQHVGVTYRKKDGKQVNCEITDLELVVDRAQCTDSCVRFVVRGDGLDFPINYALDQNRYFEPVDPTQDGVFVQRGLIDLSPLIDYINNNPVSFFCADFSQIRGAEHIKVPADGFVPFDSKRITDVNWLAANVDIQREFALKGKKSAKISIHDHLRVTLCGPDNEVVIYDHGNGEIADFVTIGKKDGMVVVSLYHGKGSGGKAPGDRVDDVYEVCAQVVKCHIWLDEPRLRGALKDRLAGGSTFVKGDQALLNQLLDAGTRNGFRFQVAVVQPGITKSGLTEKLAHVLAAADDYVRNAGSEPLLVMASA